MIMGRLIFERVLQSFLVFSYDFQTCLELERLKEKHVGQRFPVLARLLPCPLSKINQRCC